MVTAVRVAWTMNIHFPFQTDKGWSAVAKNLRRRSWGGDWGSFHSTGLIHHHCHDATFWLLNTQNAVHLPWTRPWHQTAETSQLGSNLGQHLRPIQWEGCGKCFSIWEEFFTQPLFLWLCIRRSHPWKPLPTTGSSILLQTNGGSSLVAPKKWRVHS